jgi:ribosomal protein S12 methylthiotransferase accessory factor
MSPGQASPVDILTLEQRLVSEHCGLLRRLHRVYKDPAEPEIPFIYRAEIANHQFLDRPKTTPLSASGKGATEDDAKRSALGEAVERYCALRHPKEGLVMATRSELPGAIDPRRLVLYAPDQYAALPYHPYADDLVVGWVRGQTLGHAGDVWLPAQAVFLGYAGQGELLGQQTSNGLAAGATWDDAAGKALLEVIERDAFIVAWCARRTPRRIDWRDLPVAVARQAAVAYGRRGVEIELLQLPSDHDVPVFAALGIEEAAHGIAVVVGLGAALDPASAAASAILEVAQVRPALRMKLRDPAVRARAEALVADPGRVRELEDHDLLYTDRRMLGAFDMWRQGPLEAMTWAAPGAACGEGRLQALERRLGAVGARAHLCAVTSPDIARLGLHVARAIIEDYQPIHFGHDEIRLAGPRLYSPPHGAGAPLTRADLNPLPHPLA